MKASGIVLVVIGVVMVFYSGIDFITTKKVVDIGPIKIDKEENHPIQWSPLVGIGLIIGGIVVTLRGRKEGINS